MSFSSDVKTELYALLPGAAHCAAAELCGILAVLPFSVTQSGLLISTDNERLSRKIFTLAKKAYKIEMAFAQEKHTGKKAAVRLGTGAAEAQKITEGCKNCLPPGRSCCRRAFLRGAFLAGGTMSDPESGYHFELICPEEEAAENILSVLRLMGLSGRRSQRKGGSFVYLKEGDQIVALLGEMGAHKALLDLENTRILRGMRGSVNRRVNCETANIQKTVATARRQIREIEKIRDSVGLSALPEALRETAVLRLAKPEASLEELGAALEPPLKKSGVNHRMEKISQFAADL